ncbi:hypothetical protein QQ045_004219 [Rhodiola kirilowii]
MAGESEPTRICKALKTECWSPFLKVFVTLHSQIQQNFKEHMEDKFLRDVVKTLYGSASTTANRQSICKCLRSALNGVSYNNQNVKNAQSLPSKCGVDVPYAYKVTPQTKCEQ